MVQKTLGADFALSGKQASASSCQPSGSSDGF
jgi:hypothetical protein